MTEHSRQPSPEEARSLLAAAHPVPRASRQDRALVAAGIAGTGLALGAVLVWGVSRFQDDRLFLPIWVAYGVALVALSFLRTRASTTPYDSRRLSLVAAVLTVPAIVAGLLVAHLPWGPAVPYQVLGFVLIATPSIVVGRRVLRGEPG